MIATITLLAACKVIGAMGIAVLFFAVLVASTEHRPDPSPDPEPFPYEHRAYGRTPVEHEQVGIASAEHSAWKKAA